MLCTIAIIFIVAVVLVFALVFAAVILIRRYLANRPQRRIQYATPDFTDRAGFRLEEYPSSEILIPRRFWLLSGQTAEIDYTIVPNNRAELRVARNNHLQEPDGFVDADYESVEKFVVDGITVTQSQSPGRRAMFTWTRDGFDYSLTAEDPEMTLMGGVSTPFIDHTRAEES